MDKKSKKIKLEEALKKKYKKKKNFPKKIK